MPCFACGVRQTDPVRGPSAWKKLVRRGEQVLVCPDCSTTPGWDGDADRCATCGSPALSKSLGMLRCKACGVTAAGESSAHPAPAEGLSDDVGRALDRIFGREGS